MDEMTMVLTAQNIVCPKCGSKLFKEVVALKRISPLVSPTGKEEIIPIPMFACIQCGEIPDEYKNRKNYEVIMGESNIKTEEKPVDDTPSIIIP